MLFCQRVEPDELGHQSLCTVGLLGGEGGTRRFQFLQCRSQIGQGNGVTLQNQAEHVGGRGLRRRMHDRSTAVAASHGYQTLGLENAQCLAQGHQTHPESLDEDILAGEQIAVGKFTVENLPTEFLGDDLGRSSRGQSTSSLGANSYRGHSVPAADVESDAVLHRRRSC